MLHGTSPMHVGGLRTIDLRTVDDGRGPESTSGPVALTVRAWGDQWLQAREREGVRSVRDDRSRWRTHVESETWAALPLASVTRAHARAWLTSLCERRRAHRLDERPSRQAARGLLAPQTLRNTLNLVRRCFGDALDEGLIDANPFAGLTVRRSRCATTGDRWTVLRPEEQRAALAALTGHVRLMAAVALGTGLRQGEQMAMRLEDVTTEGPDPHVVVRYGRHGKPTKSGKPRRVPLFGLALEALRAWLLELPTFAPSNPLGLVWPNADGSPRRFRPCARFDRKVAPAIGRPMRWHDWRHTCASSLVAGWWGPPWSLEEVRVLLGHSTVRITERYAHFAHDVVMRAAARMRGPDVPAESGTTEVATVEARETTATGRAVALEVGRLLAEGGAPAQPVAVKLGSEPGRPVGETVGRTVALHAGTLAEPVTVPAEQRTPARRPAWDDSGALFEGDEESDKPIPYVLAPAADFSRRGRDSNPCVTVLQTAASPVGGLQRDGAPCEPATQAAASVTPAFDALAFAQRAAQGWLLVTFGGRHTLEDESNLAALLVHFHEESTAAAACVAAPDVEAMRAELVRARESLALREAELRAVGRVAERIRTATGILTDLDALADRVSRFLDAAGKT